MFEATHAVILRLIEKGVVTGLRIDHVDGLRDPLGYLRRLQERVAGRPGSTTRHPPFYVIVEKILAKGEKLPSRVARLRSDRLCFSQCTQWSIHRF